MSVLAYTPFIDPINAHSWWYLLIVPLALGISVAFKAVRCGDMRRYPRQVLMMTVQIVAGVVGLAAACYAVLYWIIPFVTPMPGA